MEKKVKYSLVVIIILGLAFSYWFFFLKIEKCETFECFKKNLINCKRTTFQREENFVYKYKIIGEKKDECVVEVKILFTGGDPKLNTLLNKKMTCSLPLNYFTLPEKEIKYCTGPLKEEAQYLLIRDAYTYLSQNLGK